MKTAAAEWPDWPMGWTLSDVVDATGARTSAAPNLFFDAVCTDSRRILSRSLFVALRGSSHDGHRFVAEALAAGAAAALVERPEPGAAAARLLVVGDTLRALGELAAWTRRRFAPTVIGVTGSNGKTTTKEMIASICAAARFAPPRSEVLKTHGNENNLVGVPLTLLRLTGKEAVAVIEMGMNARGEIARLTEIAMPDVGVVTNVGPAHLEGLGSIAGVAAAKGELFAGMRAGSTIVVNTDDRWVTEMAASFTGRRVEIGAGREVEARSVRDHGLDGVTFDLCVGGESRSVRLAMAGLHNVSNALAAAAAAHAIGIDLAAICAGLGAASSPPMRTQVVKLRNGVTVVNDGYNANPASTQAALRLLGAQEGRRVAVIGEMRELGSAAPELHREVGAFAARAGVEVLVAVGDLAEEIARGARDAGLGAAAIRICPDSRSAAGAVIALWRPGDVVLLKGSRGADDEEAVHTHGSRMAAVLHALAEEGGRP